MTNRKSESVGSANADVSHLDARVKGRNKARGNGLWSGKNRCGIGVDMDMQNRVVIRLGVVELAVRRFYIVLPPVEIEILQGWRQIQGCRRIEGKGSGRG